MEDEDTLRERIAELELARTESGLELGDTISALTLATSKALRSKTAPLPGTDTLKDESTDLPFLTLHLSADSASAATELAVVELIGEGGMGYVYLAHQRSMRRDVAVKTLKPNATTDVARALLREARMTGMLEHPGIIPVHALGVDEAKNPILVMKRIEGKTLAHDIAKNGPFTSSSERLALGIETLIKVCHTMELAHSRGIIHRDIKPENIMLGSFGAVYLVDWGIASVKGEPGDGSIVGTPIYMAPEMVRGRGVDERTDVYLLGATLHEMLTGRPRHEGKTLLEISRSATISAPYEYDRSVPEVLARICNRATTRIPDERHASAAELREALTAFLRHRSAETLARSAVERVAQLEAIVARTPSTIDLTNAHRLAAEARFGLTESLRQDAKGNVAAEGMRRLNEAAVDLELRQDHLENAEALLAEIDAPDPKLLARVDACRKRVAKQKSEHVRLKRIARDADPTVGATKRTRQIIILTMAIALSGSVVWVIDLTVTPKTLLVAGGLIFSFLVTSVVVGRKRIMTNAFNTKIVALSLLAMGGLVIDRIGAFLANRPPDETLRHDLFIFMISVGAAAITLYRRFWLMVPVLGAGYFAIVRWPEVATKIFIITTLIDLVLGMILLAQARRDDTA